MNFKELKPGFPVYILNRKDMGYKCGSVVSVSMPHADAKMGGVMSMVVDVIVDFDGSKSTYCMVAESETAYPDGKVISTDVQHIKREVESIKLQAEQALSQVEGQKETLTKCKELLAELDPVQKERQANEERFSRLEESLGKLTNMIEQFIK